MVTYFFKKAGLAFIFISLLSTISAWEYPRTKERVAILFEVEPGVLLKGPSSKLNAIYQISNGAISDPFGSINKQKWQISPGLRAMAQVLTNNKQEVEFVYSGLYDWKREKTITQAPDGIGMNTAPHISQDWISADRITWKSNASFNSYEVSGRYYITPRFEDYFSLSFMLGARAFNFSDKETFLAYSSAVEPLPSPSQLTLSTKNNFMGGELGFGFSCRLLSYLIWNVQMKAGGFANRVSKTSFLTDQDNTVQLVAEGESDTKTEPAFLGEFLPSVVFMGERCYFKIMGTGVWVGGVSKSVDSLHKSKQVKKIAISSKLLLVGANLGVGILF